MYIKIRFVQSVLLITTVIEKLVGTLPLMVQSTDCSDLTQNEHRSETEWLPWDMQLTTEWMKAFARRAGCPGPVGTFYGPDVYTGVG